MAWGKKKFDERNFLRQLPKLGPPSSLFLAGPEILLRDAVVAEMTESVLGSGREGRLNREVYSGRDTPLSDLVAGLRIVGLFAETRLTILHDVERYGRSGQADRTDFWRWLERPSHGIHLVIVSEKPLWELSRSNQFVKGTLARADAVVSLDHPSAERAEDLIRRAAAKKYDLELGTEAAHRLVQAIGPNLLELSHELERLAIRLGRGGKVEVALLDDWLRGGLVGTVNDLEGALLSRNREMALRYWEAVRRQFPAPAVTWMIGSRHLDTRWGRGQRPDRVDERHLSKLLRACYGIEFGIKSGRIPAAMQGSALEQMIWDLTEID